MKIFYIYIKTFLLYWLEMSQDAKEIVGTIQNCSFRLIHNRRILRPYYQKNIWGRGREMVIEKKSTLINSGDKAGTFKIYIF